MYDTGPSASFIHPRLLLLTSPFLQFSTDCFPVLYFTGTALLQDKALLRTVARPGTWELRQGHPPSLRSLSCCNIPHLLRLYLLIFLYLFYLLCRFCLFYSIYPYLSAPGALEQVRYHHLSIPSLSITIKSRFGPPRLHTTAQTTASPHSPPPRDIPLPGNSPGLTTKSWPSNLLHLQLGLHDNANDQNFC